jgi:hypothetical protein
MQADIKTICKKLSKEKNIDYNLLKAVGDTVFKETKKVLNNPPNLIINLKGLGRWYLRKQQMERKIEYLEDYYKYESGVLPEPLGKYWENKEVKEKLEALLPVYEKYLNRKQEVRDLRVELGFTKIIELTDDEED